MSIETVLYLVSMVSNLDCVLAILCVVSGLGLIGGTMILVSSDGGVQKPLKILAITFLTTLIIGVFVPDEKYLLAIIGVHYLKDTQVPAKVELLLNTALDKEIAKLKGTK